jgi:hypothetical protein
MADGFVGLIPDSSGKKADTAELARPDNSLVERQRMVIGDNTNPNAYLDIDPFVRTQRQMTEIASLENYEQAINLAARGRGTERGLSIDRRGGIHRGSTR